MCRKDQSQIPLCGYLEPEIAPKQRSPTEFNWTCYLVQLYMIILSPCLAFQLCTKNNKSPPPPPKTFLIHQMIKMNRVFSSFSWHMSRKAHGPDDASFYIPSFFHTVREIQNLLRSGQNGELYTVISSIAEELLTIDVCWDRKS